jgi:hypothetical protein
VDGRLPATLGAAARPHIGRSLDLRRPHRLIFGRALPLSPLDDGGRLAGAYVTTTDEAAVLISRNRYGCASISAVPRNRSARIWIGPDKIAFGTQPPPCVRSGSL